MLRQFRLSVSLSHACFVSKRLNVSSKFFHGLIGLYIILVFRQQGSLRKPKGFIPDGDAKYKGVAIFGQYAAISRKR